MSDPVERQDAPIPVEKPVCPTCGQDLDSSGVCMDRCGEEKTDETPAETPSAMRHG